MALRSSAPQYVGTAEEAKEAVENLVLDLEVSPYGAEWLAAISCQYIIDCYTCTQCD